MPTVRLTLPHHAYDITIAPGSLERIGEMVNAAIFDGRGGRAAAIVDEAVEATHGRAAARSLEAAGVSTLVAVMTPSERKKTLGTVRSLLEVMLDARLERGHPVVAIGGGITGDVAGFVASIYLRGVPLVQVPTTLLAMVDASVGGKTGVNAPQGKNLIGAFHQPAAVVIDPLVLNTLNDRELRCGLAECVKHAVIRDPSLMSWIGTHADDILGRDPNILTELIERNVRIKAAVVEGDERESGERAHLNFGHTFAHAIEAVAKYGTKWKHGEAVSLGMVAATHLAVDLKRCPPHLLDDLTGLLDKLGLPTRDPNLAPTAMLMKAMGADKKVRGGQVRLILPDGAGTSAGVSIVGDVDPEKIRAAWDALRL